MEADMIQLAAQPSAAWMKWLAAQMPVPPPVQVPADARIQTHRYILGNARLIAFERNVSYTMTEDLKQGGGNEALEKAITFEATLAQAGHVYDLRSGKYLGEAGKFTVQLDPWQPALFAVTKSRLPDGDVLKALESR